MRRPIKHLLRPKATALPLTVKRGHDWAEFVAAFEDFHLDLSDKKGSRWAAEHWRKIAQQYIDDLPKSLPQDVRESAAAIHLWLDLQCDHCPECSRKRFRPVAAP